MASQQSSEYFSIGFECNIGKLYLFPFFNLPCDQSEGSRELSPRVTDLCPPWILSGPSYLIPLPNPMIKTTFPGYCVLFHLLIFFRE